MLLCTRGHFIRSLEKVLAGQEGHGTDAERQAEGAAMTERVRLYATDESANKPGADVWFWGLDSGFRELFKGIGPRQGQRVVYVDGGFDLFSSGHIEFLRLVTEAEEELARKDGWYSEQAVNERKGKGADYGPVFVVAGVHDDEVINQWKGVNYPIMNIFERGLCVLQCRVSPQDPGRCCQRVVTDKLQYVNAVVFGAPFTPTKSYLTTLPWGTPDAVYHGPTSFMPSGEDVYADPKALGIYQEIGHHEFEDVNAGTIVQRIMQSRELYEARQKAKGMKADLEAAHRQRELLEEEQRKKEATR